MNKPKIKTDFFCFQLPPTLNQMINAARSNRYLSADQKKKYTNSALESIINQGFKPWQGKVYLTVEFKLRQKSRHDPDNLLASLKFIMDAFVKAGVLPDDSLKYIQSPVISYYTEDKSLEYDYVEIIFSSRLLPLRNNND